MKVWFVDNGVGTLIHISDDKATQHDVQVLHSAKMRHKSKDDMPWVKELKPAITKNSFYIDIESNTEIEVS